MRSATENQRYTPFALTVAQSDGEFAVLLAGELDLESAGRLRRRVSQLQLTRMTEIVIDLRNVDFIDSSGLRVLLALRNDAKRNGHTLTLVPPAPTVGRVFAITGTWSFFDWRASEPCSNGSGQQPRQSQRTHA
jgi:anti-sigma B factor antagonist